MRIVFMGTPAAAVPSLERLIADGHSVAAVYTQPDRPAGRGKHIAMSPVKKTALEHGLPVFQPERIKTDEALELFRSHNADIAVVVAYGRILPESFLTAYRSGAVNVHFSLLPKYRGAAPVNWAIVNGETQTGVTTMLMDTGLDTGDILLQAMTDIRSDETSIELMERLSHIGADLLSETLINFEKITPQKQDDPIATHAPMLRKEDGLFDWSLPAEEIARRVRGFQPFPTTYSYFTGKKLTIWKCQAAERSSDNAELSVITGIENDSITVRCGMGDLKIEELQIEGKRRMSGRDFLNGHRLKVGSRLGE